MQISGARWVNAAVNVGILVSSLAILHLVFIGGIDLRVGGVVPALGTLKLTCNKLRNPVIVLAVLLLLKPVVVRPAPARRLAAWLKVNRRTILLAALVALAAAVPRLARLSAHSLNPDSLLWLDRSQKTVYAIRDGDYMKATAHLGHPGVVPAVLIGASYIYLGEGTFTLSWGFLDGVTAARLPIALVGTLTCVLLYLLARRLFGDPAAFWGAVFLAFYPPHVALSRVIHIDSTLALFFMCAILCYAHAVETGRGAWAAASAVSFGLALLTKSPALLIPLVLVVWKACIAFRDRGGGVRFFEVRDLAWLGMGLATYFILFTRLWLPPSGIAWAEFASSLPCADQAVAAVRLVSDVPLAAAVGAALAAGLLSAATARRGGAHALLARVLFFALACLAFVRIFNAPIQNQILLASKTYHIEELGHLKYWMGRTVTHPPRIFYLFMLCIQSPPAVLLCALAGIASAVAAFAARSGRWRAMILPLAAFAVFVGVMSRGNKMAVRYVAPVFPFICLLAGAGFARLAGAACRRTRAGDAAQAAAGALVAASCVVPLVRLAPYPDIYFNLFAGGPAGASRMVSIGAGVGTREAAAFLKPQARDDDSIYATTIHGEFRWHWLNDGPKAGARVLINRTKPPHVDWVVFPLADRFRPQSEGLRSLDGKCPRVWGYMHSGVDFVDVYKVDDPPEEAGRAYEAEELTVEAGAKAVDNAASAGVAVRGRGRGTVLRGPWERYAPGEWRAVFRIKGGGEPGGRLAVAGLSRQEVFGARDLQAGDPAAGGAYRDVAIDFSLAAPRRIQFCVEQPGPGEVWVDKITVSRRR